MKYDCGESWVERRIAALRREFEWHRWFAWYPVRISGTTDAVWLEYVERRIISNGNPYDYQYYGTEYRELP
jgi:hypothetical protein